MVIAVAVVVGITAILLFDVTGEKGSGLGKEFIYDIKDKTQIDPKQLLYEQIGEPIATDFQAARAIAIDPSGQIYIAGDKSIKIIQGDRIELTDEPKCLAVTNNKIYIGFKNHVEVYDPDGTKLAVWDSLGEDAYLTSIAVSKNNVFVADAGNRVVIAYDTAGKIINYIGRKDKDRNIPGFVIPSPYFDLLIGSDGLLRVVNPGLRRIEAYTFGGDLEFWWGKSSANIDGFCGCCNPVSFAVLSDGSFVTCEKGLMRVKIYDPEGKFIGAVAGPQQLIPLRAAKVCNIPVNCQSGGFDVAVDKQDRILVLDTIDNVVKKFSRKK